METNITAKLFAKKHYGQTVLYCHTLLANCIVLPHITGKLYCTATYYRQTVLYCHTLLARGIDIGRTVEPILIEHIVHNLGKLIDNKG